LHADLEWMKSQENLLTPTAASLLRKFPSETLPQLPKQASVYDSLLLATEVYASLASSHGYARERSFEDDFPPPKDGPSDPQAMPQDDHGAGVMVEAAQMSAQQRE